MLIVGAIVAAIVLVISFATFYKTPTCSDGKENQGEQGIDCGGPCPYLCSALEDAPSVLFTQVVNNGTGRADVVAEVENKNMDAAAKSAPYTVAFYDATHTLLGRVTGTMDLPPGASVPVYIPGVASGQQTIASAFLSFDPAAVSWYRLSRDPRVVPVVSNIVQSGVTNAPRIDATLTDPSAASLTNVRAIVLVKDAGGNVIAASQTVLPVVPAQGSANATFTWSGAFSGPVVSVEVVPVIPLP